MSNMTCPVCGANVTAGQRFCGECGSRLSTTQAPASQGGDAAGRNSVMHRPGGGEPDPFSVGSAASDYGDDDFFSQFVPKSQAEQTDAPIQRSAPEDFPSRRSRRRFNPNVFETGPVEDARAGDTGQVPPMFPQHVDEASGQPSTPPAAAAPQHSAPAASPFEESGEPVEPKTRQMSLEEIQAAMNSDEAEARAADDARTAETWPVDTDRRRVADEATFTQLIEGLPDDPADRPLQSPQYVRDDVDAAQPEPSPFEAPQDAQPQAEPQAEPQQAESEFAPLPESEIDPQQREQQERANAFFAAEPEQQATPEPEPEPEPRDERADMPSLPPLAAQQQPERADTAGRDFSFDNLMADFTEPEEQSERNQEVSPASNRDWRASDRRAAEQATAVGAGAGIPAGGNGGGPTGPSGPTGPEGADPKYSADEVQRRRKGVMTILIAAAAAVVLIIGAFGISALFRGGDSAPVADGESQSAQATDTPASSSPNVGGGLGDGGPSESATATTEPTTEPFDPVTFQSGSGNIRCQITEETGVACQLTATNFAAPAGMCQNGMSSGAAVGVTTDGATYPCLTSGLGGGQALDYDTPITAGPYTCSINFSTGVSCDNGDGDGFSMEYSAGITITGDMAAEPHPEVAPVG